MENITKYLKINFLVSTGKSTIIGLITIIFIPLIINRVGLELYGAISLTLLFSGISGIADLGLSKAIVLLSGSNKINESRVFTSALILNVLVIVILTLIFLSALFFDVDFFGKNINLSEHDTFLLVCVSFYILILTLINNALRAVLESNLLIHLVNIGFIIYNVMLYLLIFIISFVTWHFWVFILIPAIVTTFLLILNIYFVINKTGVRICKTKIIHVKYLLKSTIQFLNLGLINSMINPSLRYFIVLKVADTSLYGVFDLALKMAMSIGGLISSIAMPMLAVFAKSKTLDKTELIKTAYRIFYVSFAFLMLIVVIFFLLGDLFIHYLKINESHKVILFQISKVLIVSVGFLSSVEVFARYLMGTNQITHIFLIKLIIPIIAVVSYFLLENSGPLFRFVYAYALGLMVSSIVLIISFNKLKKAEY